MNKRKFFLKLDEILLIHSDIIQANNGSEGFRDANALESLLRATKFRLFYANYGRKNNTKFGWHFSKHDWHLHCLS
jgi:hypothetical protein